MRSDWLSRPGRARAMSAYVVLAALWCTIAAGAEPSQRDQAVPVCDSCGAGKTFRFDAREVFTSPVRWQKREWRSAAIKTGAIVGSMWLLDEPVRDYIQDHRSSAGDRVAKTFEPFGERYAAGVLAGFALIGHAAGKAPAREAAFDGIASTVIAAGVIVPALKELSGRSRPRTGSGASDLNPLSGAESFPSGHTAAAFAVAGSIASHYDQRWVKGLAYGVAGLVGYSRMVHDAHWLSDVAAGAFIGIGVSREVSKMNLQRRGIVVVPLHERDEWGIRIARAF
jgi:hypothetical protein